MTRSSSGHAVVTGGARGIGAAIARRLCEEGNAVTIADLDGDSANKTAEALVKAGFRSVGLQCDISNSEQVAGVFAPDALAFGPVSILVNNAGWDRHCLFREFTRTDWDRQIGINLYGVLNMHAAVLPGMIANHFGRIVNISSEAARVGVAGASVYAACKSALFGFSKSLAHEHALDGITVNVVCPGPTESPMLFEAVQGAENPEETLRSWAAGIPVGRLGQPEDVARLVAFLAQEESEYITGQVISVSGGFSMIG